MPTPEPIVPPKSENSDRFFWRVFALTLGIKLLLAAVVPLTGDEAYFVVWGRHPDYGYYDHGPMTGWWLWFMLLFGQSTWWVRVPAVLVPLAAGWLLRGVLRPIDRDKGNIAATLFLLSPGNVLNVLITTDTPLLFFSAISTVLVYRALRQNRLRDFSLAGFFLGLAFLSKFFAVLLGLAFAVLLLGFRRPAHWRGLTALLAGVLPSAAVVIAWNYNHYWENLLFNVVNRNAGARLSPASLPAYLGTIAVLLGPGVLYYLLRRRFAGRLGWPEGWSRLRDAGLHVFVLAAAVPLLVLGLIAIMRNVGLHWALSFYPFLFAGLFGLFTGDGLRAMVRPMACYSFALAGIVVVAMGLPLDLAQRHKSYPTIVLGVHPEEVLAAAQAGREDCLLSTPSYAKSALLGFHSRRYVPVIGLGSYHARQDDLLTDFRTLDGRNIAVLAGAPKELEPMKGWFREAEVRELRVRGAPLALLAGRGFRYAVYREEVLKPVAERYYRMPAWLKPLSKPHGFPVRYDLEATLGIEEGSEN